MSNRSIEEPVTVEGVRDFTETTHPAFAQITLHRGYGGRGRALYGSDFLHTASLTLAIYTSRLNRGLNQDWHHADRQLVEVEMSEAQWATFVSAVGQGSGVPCTLRYLRGEEVPGLPDPTPRTDQFADELLEDFQRILKRCDDLIAGAKTKAQASEIALLKQDLEKNLPFVAKQFERHMESTVEAAKSEVHGYMTGAIQRAGLAALGVEPPLRLEHQEPEE